MNTINHIALALVTVALLSIAGVARAITVQYDFATTASIAVNGGSAISVDNALLSFIVDWDTIDNSGPTTTASGTITSIFATIPTNAAGFETALLNDNTVSSLSPFFTTLGFNTTLVAGADSDLSALGTTYYSFLNEISALDPFGLNPIFGGQFILGSATEEDIDNGVFRDRNYAFQMSAEGTGGTYAFTEELSSAYFDLFSDDFGDESVSISYELGQLTGTTTVVPIPEPATLTLMGLGIVAALRRKKKSAQA